MYLARSVLDHDEAILADGSSLLRIGGRGSCISAVKMDIMMLFSHCAESGRQSNSLSPGVLHLRSPRRPFSPQHESCMGNEGAQVGSVQERVATWLKLYNTQHTERQPPHIFSKAASSDGSEPAMDRRKKHFHFVNCGWLGPQFTECTRFRL